MPDSAMVRVAGTGPDVSAALAGILSACVEDGASVGFMAPLPHGRAVAFWDRVGESVSRRERVVLVAEEAGRLVGTVQVVLSMPENQPHRAEIAKLLVHPQSRRRGVGEALMRVAESVARKAGKSLLVLDTATGGAAERLYDRLGWTRCGTIPGYALLPHGGRCATTLFFKELDEVEAGIAHES